MVRAADLRAAVPWSIDLLSSAAKENSPHSVAVRISKRKLSFDLKPPCKLLKSCWVAFLQLLI